MKALMILLFMLAGLAAQNYVPLKFRPQVEIDADKAPVGTLACAQNVFMSTEGHAWASRKFLTRADGTYCKQSNQRAVKWPGGWDITLNATVTAANMTDDEALKSGYVEMIFISVEAEAANPYGLLWETKHE